MSIIFPLIQALQWERCLIFLPRAFPQILKSLNTSVLKRNKLFAFKGKVELEVLHITVPW